VSTTTRTGIVALDLLDGFANCLRVSAPMAFIFSGVELDQSHPVVDVTVDGEPRTWVAISLTCL